MGKKGVEAFEMSPFPFCALLEAVTEEMRQSQVL